MKRILGDKETQNETERKLRMRLSEENERLRAELNDKRLSRYEPAYVGELEQKVEGLRDANISIRRDLQTSWEEKDRLREENERLRKLTDYLRNGEVNIDEEEREYARLRRIEEAARRFLNAEGLGSQVSYNQAKEALRAVLADQPTEEKLTPSQELMYAEDGYDQPTEEEA